MVADNSNASFRAPVDVEEVPPIELCIRTKYDCTIQSVTTCRFTYCTCGMFYTILRRKIRKKGMSVAYIWDLGCGQSNDTFACPYCFKLLSDVNAQCNPIQVHENWHQWNSKKKKKIGCVFICYRESYNHRKIFKSRKSRPSNYFVQIYKAQFVWHCTCVCLFVGGRMLKLIGTESSPYVDNGRCAYM